MNTHTLYSPIAAEDILLQEELELKYGPAMAQDIVDQIQKAALQENSVEYMPVKAASEVMELFRDETKKALVALKKHKNLNLCESDVQVMQEVALRRRVEKLLKIYTRAHRCYFYLYRKAMASYTKKAQEVPVYRQEHKVARAA